MALMHVDFFSDVLGMCMQMDVILPQRTYRQIGMTGVDDGGSYPTLYLLHGMSDDHTIWQRRTSIERYVSDLGIAVVMPSTHLGWYTDMAVGGKYFTFISDELPKICRDFFPRMSARREDTFAAGLSMGGYGAFKLGLLCPETYGAVASLSGALDVGSDELLRDDPYWRSVFGQISDFSGSHNDLIAQVKTLRDSRKPIPKFFAWCGSEDFLIKQNYRMKEKMEKYGFDLTFTTSPGDHQWKYWDAEIQNVLKWLPLNTAK